MPSASSEREVYIRRAIHHAAICLQWQASDVGTENGGDGYPISDGGDEHTEAVAKVIAKEVGSWIRLHKRELDNAGVTAEQAGHDLILTANHHGAGFWDRGLGDAGRELTNACKGMSFDAEFALAGDRRITGDYNSDDLVWLMVENTVIFNETQEAWGDNWEASDN